VLAALLAGCGSPLPRLPEAAKPAVTPPKATAKLPSTTGLKKGGGFYKDDGPGDDAPENVDAIPDAVPRNEPLHRFANNPYSALGQDFVPMKKPGTYKARGIGSWYGRKFHGQKTSSGERYDMYGMSAAHPTLPIPSYVRVSRPGTDKSVVVRVNDRGPFHAGRLIDLSWTAAHKLGYVGEGSTLVEVELILPGQTAAAPTEKPAVIASRKADAADDPILQFVSAEPPPAKPLLESRDEAGHFIQLGAFGNRDNAESLRAHLARELGTLGERLVIRPSGTVFRVQLGPWPDAGAARQAGDQLRETLGLKPVVVGM
jgi:rare lipoprotein A